MNDESGEGMVETNSKIVDNFYDEMTRKEENNLVQAYKLKDEANEKYNNKDYAGAIRLYHSCLLFARSIQQLSQFNLEGLARLERAKHDCCGTATDVATNHTPVNDEESRNGSTDGSKAQQQENGDGAHRKRLNSTLRGEEMKREASDLVLKCYNNLAACILSGPARKAEDYMRAVEYCDKVLMQDDNNEKALFRKGSALAKASQNEQAVNILKRCKSREAKALTLQCQKVLDEERRRRDDQIRRNFARNMGNLEAGNEEPIHNASATMNGTAGIGASDEQPHA